MRAHSQNTEHCTVRVIKTSGTGICTGMQDQYKLCTNAYHGTGMTGTGMMFAVMFEKKYPTVHLWGRTGGYAYWALANQKPVSTTSTPGGE